MTTSTAGLDIEVRDVDVRGHPGGRGSESLSPTAPGTTRWARARRARLSVFGWRRNRLPERRPVRRGCRPALRSTLVVLGRAFAAWAAIPRGTAGPDVLDEGDGAGRAGGHVVQCPPSAEPEPRLLSPPGGPNRRREDGARYINRMTASYASSAAAVKPKVPSRARNFVAPPGRNLVKGQPLARPRPAISAPKRPRGAAASPSILVPPLICGYHSSPHRRDQLNLNLGRLTYEPGDMRQ